MKLAVSVAFVRDQAVVVGVLPRLQLQLVAADVTVDARTDVFAMTTMGGGVRRPESLGPVKPSRGESCACKLLTPLGAMLSECNIHSYFFAYNVPLPLPRLVL